MPYYVVQVSDELDGPFITWSDDEDKTETFKNHKAAEKRAIKLAKENPGSVYFVAKSVAKVAAVVSDPVVEITEE